LLYEPWTLHGVIGWLSPTIPLSVLASLKAWRAILNYMRRHNILGLDRRHGDRRSRDIAVDRERRSGLDRRRPAAIWAAPSP